MYEICFRTKRAYYMANTILAFTALLGLATFSYTLSLVALVVLLILFSQRKRFVRVSHPFSFSSAARIILVPLVAAWLYAQLISATLEALNQPPKVSFGYYLIALTALLFAYAYTLIFVYIFGKFYRDLPGEEPDPEKLRQFSTNARRARLEPPRFFAGQTFLLQ